MLEPLHGVGNENLALIEGWPTYLRGCLLGLVFLCVLTLLPLSLCLAKAYLGLLLS